MHLSRLLSAMLVVGVAGGATIVACGGNSSPKTPDAKVFKDAPKVFMDAPPGSAAGIGADCTGGGSGNATLCPTADPQCTSLTGTKWFCTEGCGYGSCGSGGTFGSSSCTQGTNQPAPPSGGNAICAMQAASTTATPVCALFGDGPNAGSAVAWSCGLACGMNGSANYGTCPSNLSCVDFTGKTYGFCQ